MTIFKYNDGLPGSNKTGAIVQITDQLALRNQGSVHAVPSKKLANEVSQRHTQPSKVIHSDTVDGVGHEFKEALKSLQQPLIVTHHAILGTEKIKENDLILFFDEAFDPTIHLEFNLSQWPNIKEVFRSLLTVDTSTKYTPITAKNKKELWQKIFSLREQSQQVTLWEQSNDLERLLTYVGRARHYDVWSHNSYNNDFLYGDGEKFVVTVAITPHVFFPWQEVIFTSAGFTHSMLYHLWKKEYGIEWIEDVQVKKHLLPVKKPNINVYYWAENRGWSKSFYEQTQESQTLKQQLYDDIQQLIQQKNIPEVLLAKNKTDQYQLQCPHQILPFNSAGLNEYDHHTTFIETGAYNKSSAYYQWMSHIGLAKEAKAEVIEKIYQAFYRLKHRKDHSTSNLIIPAKSLFPHYMKDRFNEVNMTQFGNLNKELDVIKLAGRPKGTTKVDIDWKKKRQWLLNLKSEAGKIMKDDGRLDGRLKVTFFDKPVVNNNKIVAVDSVGDLMEFGRNKFYETLLVVAEKKIQSKFENILYSLIEYKDNIRENDKAIQCHGITLDFDTEEEEGEMNYQKLKQVIGQDLECLIHGTFSGGFRKRVIIVFKEAIDPDEYLSLSQYWFDEFINTFPKCKLDPKIKSLAQPYFLPRKSSVKAEYHKHKTFDARHYIYGSLAKSENETKYTKPIHSINFDYQQQILPLIQQLSDGDYFDKGSMIIGKVKFFCPEQMDHTLELFKEHGMSQSNINKMKKLIKIQGKPKY
jgi:hypothetical protein